MTSTITAPYGSWPTPITTELVLSAAVQLDGLAVDAGSLWWSELRPGEGGRTVLVRDGIDVLPAPYDARTAVHEYGGGAWWVAGGIAYFANWTDQRLYRLEPGGDPVALTAEPDRPRADRWADGAVSPDGRRIACVREHHPEGNRPADVVNEIVALDVTSGAVEVVVSGPDFVSSPRWSPDGTRLAWIEWDHPNMPWDSTRLMVDGSLVAGGTGESVQQPRWAADGSLWFLSDRTDWWNLYRWTPSGETSAQVLIDAEIGRPPWGSAQSRYTLMPDGTVALAYHRNGRDHLASWDGSALREHDTPYSDITAITSGGDDIYVIAASPTAEAGLHRMRLGAERETEAAVIRAPRDLGLEPDRFSVPEPVAFPSAGGRTSHALYYRPASPTHGGPPGELPPLLVTVHGGPTAAARRGLSLGTQFWTSRGFAVVDVDYGGSTGYGRAYRELLRGQWGIVDVEDCLAAVRHLVDTGRADPERICIRGGSAGGFTVLAALANSDVFAAGANHFGVSDLGALARETHKFESRYLDGLVGPYPERRDLYEERSPINHLEGFTSPLIVLQGLEDEVVPPAQSEMIVNALRAKRVAVAYLTFEGEQHGFRKAANIRAALEAELSFYSQILGFPLPPDEGISRVVIENAT